MLPDGFRDSLEDFDQALSELDGTRGPNARRALRSALACLYEMREYTRKIAVDNYFDKVEDSTLGLVAEGIVLIRGLAVHDVTQPVGPVLRGGRYPSPTSFPSPNSFPSAPELVWRLWEQIPDPYVPSKHREVRIERYKKYVAGQPVLNTLAQAREFFANYESAKRN